MSKEDNIFVLSDGRKLGYAEYGDPKGKPLFYFHGWPSCRLQPKIIDGIAKNVAVRLISVDRPGYGLSTYKENRTILDWPDDVIELANHLKIKKFGVVGVSGGGPYAAVCGYKIPNCLTKVGIVVGLGPTWVPHALDGISNYAKFLWGNYAKYPWLRFSASFLYGMLSKFSPAFTAYILLLRSSVDKKASYAIFKKYGTKSFINPQEIFRQGIKGPMLDLYVYTKDWGFKLKDIKSKVYLFYGDTDKNVSLNMGKYYHTQIKNSVLTIYPNEGHISAITHAEEIFQTLLSI